MSNYHILAGQPDGNQLRVVFHVPVPGTSNVAGISFRDALAMYAQPMSCMPASLLGAGEQEAIDAGALCEVVWEFHTNPEMTLLDKRDIMDAKYTDLVSSVIAQLEERLEYYGYSRDVP